MLNGPNRIFWSGFKNDFILFSNLDTCKKINKMDKTRNILLSLFKCKMAIKRRQEGCNDKRIRKLEFQELGVIIFDF